MKHRSFTNSIVLTIWMLAIISFAKGTTYGQTAKAVAAPRTAADALVEPAPANRPPLAEVLNILLRVADGAKGWKDASAAAKVQAQVADLAWETDPEAGRSYLTNAWEKAGQVEESTQPRSQFRNQSLRLAARREALLVARKHAPALAKKWIDQMAEEARQEEETKPRGAFDDRTPRSTVLLDLALASLAADRPEAATELAKESLQDGISFELQAVLVALQQKDFSLAQTVFRAALLRLKTFGMVDPNELIVLYAYLYTPGKILAVSTSIHPGSNQVAVGRDRPLIKAAAEVNPDMALEFLNLAADLLLNAPLPQRTADAGSTARSQTSAINILLGRMWERLPEKAVALQTKTEQIVTDANYGATPASARDTPPDLHQGESKQDYAQRRLDLLEENAEKTSDPLGRDIAFAKAALATDAEHFERGWTLTGKIHDQDLRNGVANWICYRAAITFVKADDFDRASQLMRRNGDIVQGAAFFLLGAQRLIKTKDAVRAREWLAESRALIKKPIEPDEDLARIALGIVSTAAQFESWMALDSLSEAIKLMNKFPNAAYDDDRAPLIKRFSGIAALRDFTYGTSGFSLQAALNSLPPAQFENALYRLNDISSPELRGVATVVLCRKYALAAAGKPKKS